MSTRIGIFLAATIMGLALLLAAMPGTNVSGILRMAAIFSAIVFAIVRGLGWVLTGR